MKTFYCPKRLYAMSLYIMFLLFCSFQTISPASSSPLSPIPKPALTRSVPLTPALPSPISNSLNSSSSVIEPPLDFSSPAQFTPCLDNSAARHRMSVKPRNQRASTKKRLAAVSDHTYHSLKTYSTQHTAFNFLTSLFVFLFVFLRPIPGLIHIP